MSLLLLLRPSATHIPPAMLTKDVVKFGAFVVTNQVRRRPLPIGVP